MEDKECEWSAAAFGMIGLEPALSVVQQAMVDTGLLGWERVAEAMSAIPGEHRPRCRPRSGRSKSASPLTSCWDDPKATRTVSGNRHRVAVAQHPVRGARGLPGRVVATVLHGRPTVLDEANWSTGGPQHEKRD